MKALQVYGKGCNFSLETYTSFMAFKAFTSVPASQITVPTWPSRTPLLSTYYFPSFSFGPVFGGKDSDSILLHSVSKTQLSSTRFSVLLTCIHLCFLKGPALCRIKEMDNPMKPRETILYKNWKKNKSFIKEKEKTGVSNATESPLQIGNLL